MWWIITAQALYFFLFLQKRMRKKEWILRGWWVIFIHVCTLLYAFVVIHFTHICQNMHLYTGKHTHTHKVLFVTPFYILCIFIYIWGCIFLHCVLFRCSVLLKLQKFVNYNDGCCYALMRDVKDNIHAHTHIFCIYSKTMWNIVVSTLFVLPYTLKHCTDRLPNKHLNWQEPT